MNICVLYHDGFCGREIIVALAMLRRHNIFSTALEQRAYTSEEKLKYLPDTVLQELDPDSIDLFLIPGGKTAKALFGNPTLTGVLQALDQRRKLIAGVCWGTDLMESCGLRGDRRWIGPADDVVVDGNIITASGYHFVEFAAELAIITGTYADDAAVAADYPVLGRLTSWPPASRSGRG